MLPTGRPCRPCGRCVGTGRGEFWPEEPAFDAEGGARRGRVEGVIKAIFGALRERATPLPTSPLIGGRSANALPGDV